MKFQRRYAAISIGMIYGACMVLLGCDQVRGKPGPEPEVVRPGQVLNFATLYQQNCSACHGAEGKNGAAISLANPVYLAIVGDDHLREIITRGVSGGLMPPFARSSGGTLTEKQVDVLAQGLSHEWGKQGLLDGLNPPPYAATLQGDATRGQEAFATFCAHCHGATGEGSQGGGRSSKLGSIVDSSYLALITDQNLRSVTIAGRPDEGMPDWRSDATEPLTDQQITDIIAWLASKRVADPGQPYLSQSLQPAEPAVMRALSLHEKSSTGVNP
jgi:mono/diheme cytochrome c family protein